MRCTRRCVYAGRRWALPLHRPAGRQHHYLLGPERCHACTRRCVYAGRGIYHSIGLRKMAPLFAGARTVSQCDAPDGVLRRSQVALPLHRPAGIPSLVAGTTTASDTRRCVYAGRGWRPAPTGSGRWHGCWGQNGWASAMQTVCLRRSRRLPLHRLGKWHHRLLGRNNHGQCDAPMVCLRRSHAAATTPWDCGEIPLLIPGACCTEHRWLY